MNACRLLDVFARALLHLAAPFRHRWVETLHQNGAVTRTCRTCGTHRAEL